jgi:hypothetical protein
MNFIKKSSKKINPNLVIVRAGAGSLHHEYFYPPEESPRNWDRMIFSYEDVKNIDHLKAEFIIKGGLSKWTDLADLLKNNFFEEYSYDHIMITDDDVLPVGDESINLLFTRAKEFNFQICQPSLTHESSCYWRINYHCPAFHVRFTNFVECMSPVFSRSALGKLKLDIEHSVSGCGLDLIFYELFEPTTKPMGIIDDVQVKHMKPVDHINGAFYLHLKRNNIDPNIEIKYFLDKYNIKQKIVQTLGGIPFKQT